MLLHSNVILPVAFQLCHMYAEEYRHKLARTERHTPGEVQIFLLNRSFNTHVPSMHAIGQNGCNTNTQLVVVTFLNTLNKNSSEWLKIMLKIMSVSPYLAVL